MADVAVAVAVVAVAVVAVVAVAVAVAVVAVAVTAVAVVADVAIHLPRCLPACPSSLANFASYNSAECKLSFHCAVAGVVDAAITFTVATVVVVVAA